MGNIGDNNTETGPADTVVVKDGDKTLYASVEGSCPNGQSVQMECKAPVKEPKLVCTVTPPSTNSKLYKFSLSWDTSDDTPEGPALVNGVIVQWGSDDPEKGMALSWTPSLFLFFWATFK